MSKRKRMRSVALQAVVQQAQGLPAARDAKWAEALLLWSVSEQAKRGASILADLREAVGREPTSGHVVDALMTWAAQADKAAQANDPAAYADALVVVAFLARDLAYREGKIAPLTQDMLS